MKRTDRRIVRLLVFLKKKCKFLLENFKKRKKIKKFFLKKRD